MAPTWFLTVRSNLGEPQQFVVKPGVMSLGRQSDNFIVIRDESASRHHAEIQYTADTNTLLVTDLGSTNGTFVNRERLTQPRTLHANDEIRIGQHIISVENQRMQDPPPSGKGTSAITREVLLESLERHAILIYEVSERLATVLDLDTALREVAALIRRSMGADKSEVVLAERFDRLPDLGFPTSIAQQAISQKQGIVIPDLTALDNDKNVGKSAFLLKVRSALCVPVLTGNEVEALIYAYKTGLHSKPFDERDLQLAIAISYQTALTIQRARLLRRVRREQRVRELLQRFLAPTQAENLMQDFLRAGRLPEMAEQVVTVLFCDVRDSTALADRVGVRRFSQILSHYYQEITRIVFDHNGMIYQYMGDGIMAVFGVYDKNDPVGNAVQTGLTIIQQAGELSQTAGENLYLGIGINTGPTMAGYLEMRERIEFNVLGDTVNVCQRLQQTARNQIFIGGTTYQGLEGRFNTQPRGSLKVRGRSQPLEVYEVFPGNSGDSHV